MCPHHCIRSSPRDSENKEMNHKINWSNLPEQVNPEKEGQVKKGQGLAIVDYSDEKKMMRTRCSRQYQAGQNPASIMILTWSTCSIFISPSAERVWVSSSIDLNETTCICVSRSTISEGIKRLTSTAVFTKACTTLILCMRGNLNPVLIQFNIHPASKIYPFHSWRKVSMLIVTQVGRWIPNLDHKEDR